MALWGRGDAIALTGTISVSNGDASVVGANTLFTTEIDVGDSIIVSNVEYKVLSITDDENLELAGNYEGDTANGVSVELHQAPKYLSQDEVRDTYLVDETEAAVTANRAKGLATPGWTRYTTYTDADGATRHKAEVLVAMNVTAAQANDAPDDSVVADS